MHSTAAKIRDIRGSAENWHLGLSAAVRRTLHEGPLSGNGPNFAKFDICALLPLMQGAAGITSSFLP